MHTLVGQDSYLRKNKTMYSDTFDAHEKALDCVYYNNINL